LRQVLGENVAAEGATVIRTARAAVAALILTLAPRVGAAPGSDPGQWSLEDAIAKARVQLETVGYQVADVVGSKALKEAKLDCQGTRCRYSAELRWFAGCTFVESSFDLKDVTRAAVSEDLVLEVTIHSEGAEFTRSLEASPLRNLTDRASGCIKPSMTPAKEDTLRFPVRDREMASALEAALRQAVARAKGAPAPEATSRVKPGPEAVMLLPMLRVKQLLELDTAPVPFAGKASGPSFTCEGSACRYSFVVDFDKGRSTIEIAFDLRDEWSVSTKGSSGRIVEWQLTSPAGKDVFSLKMTLAPFKDPARPASGYLEPQVQAGKGSTIKIRGSAANEAIAQWATPVFAAEVARARAELRSK
jgi:hypothetical protein